MFWGSARSSRGIRTLSVILVLLLTRPDGVLSTANAAPQTPINLRIVILEGDAVKNDTVQRVERKLIVQLQGLTAGPIAGAEVVFTAPGSGAGGFFSNGTRTATANTDAQGIAVSSGFRPNSIAGDFQINIEASYQGQKTTATISQTNLVAAKKGGAGKWIAILAVGGGVGAAAALAGGKGGGGTSTSGTSTSGASTIRVTPVPGTPTVGPPG